MPHKTNAVRLLDQLRVPYRLRAYDVDPDDLAAETVASKIGLPPGHVLKTLLAEGDRNGFCMAVIPGDTELNLKALAAAAGDRKIHLVPVKDLQKLIRKLNTISISAGMRGLQILLAPEDYLKITNASVAAIATNKFADTETRHG
jgi:Cys-tRNA(Pro)/Cys-tRNA(Cys) deacylase